MIAASRLLLLLQPRNGHVDQHSRANVQRAADVDELEERRATPTALKQARIRPIYVSPEREFLLR